MKYAQDGVVAYAFRTFKRGTKILEYGFIDESFANFFAFSGFDFLSVSDDENLLNLAKANFKNGGGLEHFCLKSQFDKSLKFDGIFSYLALNYEQNPQNFVDAIYLLLQNGQKFLVSVFTSNDTHSHLQTNNTKTPKIFSRDELTKMFAKFKNLDINLTQTSYENGKFLKELFIITGEK